MTRNGRKRAQGYLELYVKRHQGFGIKVPVLYFASGVTLFIEKGSPGGGGGS